MKQRVKPNQATNTNNDSSNENTKLSSTKHQPQRLQSPSNRGHFFSLLFAKFRSTYLLCIVFFIAGFVTSGLLFQIAISPTSISTALPIRNATKTSAKTTPTTTKQSSVAKQACTLSVVVPYRDRFDELSTFVPHMSRFLRLKSIPFRIYVLNQVDEWRFNRASLINVGYLFSQQQQQNDTECNYIAMHDVDLLPLNDQLDYSYPNETGVYHVSAPGLHPEYSYSKFIGGVLIVSRDVYRRVNGMSNRYWGWGREDDEFFLRLTRANVSVTRPDTQRFLRTGRQFTFRHEHRETRRARDRKRFVKQRQQALSSLDTHSGLDNVQYRIRRSYQLRIARDACTVVDVELTCDRDDTHWCSTDYQFVD